MLFGDEKRFSKKLVASSGDKQVMGVVTSPTDPNLGPGAYYNSTMDEKRNGWQSNSFSRRPPMSPSPGESRQSYIGGVLTPYGTLASPVSPRDRISVGPGHYGTDILTSFSKSRPNSARNPDTPPKATTPRFAFSQSSVLKDGVLFQSKENETNPIGPGYYAAPLDNTLVRPSFNVRANGTGSPNSRPRSASSGRLSSSKPRA